MNPKCGRCPFSDVQTGLSRMR
ncbi:hypothetical protein [Sutcliffiella rhizosphaerae]